MSLSSFAVLLPTGVVITMDGAGGESASERRLGRLARFAPILMNCKSGRRHHMQRPVIVRAVSTSVSCGS
jgi:hypothetical protein